jgi:hypothetical protein
MVVQGLLKEVWSRVCSRRYWRARVEFCSARRQRGTDPSSSWPQAVGRLRRSCSRGVRSWPQHLTCVGIGVFGRPGGQDRCQLPIENVGYTVAVVGRGPARPRRPARKWASYLSCVELSADWGMFLDRLANITSLVCPLLEGDVSSWKNSYRLLVQGAAAVDR